MALDLNVDWATVDPAEVLARVRKASDEEIAAALSGDDRDEILRSVFGLMAGYVDPERTRGTGTSPAAATTTTSCGPRTERPASARHPATTRRSRSRAG